MNLTEESYFARLFALLFIILISIPALSSGQDYDKEIKNMSLSMADNILRAGKKTIAVVDFTDLQGTVTELGRFIAEELSVALASAGKNFEIVDRNNLRIILSEHKLSATGIIDPQTARQLGQIAGVDALILGTITAFGDSVRISAKLLDTNTAKIMGATSGNIAKTKAIEELLSKGLGESVRISTTPPSAYSMQSVTTPQQKKSQILSKVNTNEFSFEVQQCKIVENRLTFNLIITNNQKDRELMISLETSRIIDNAGNESKATRIQLGDQLVGTGRYSGAARKILVEGIPIKSSVVFDNVPTETSAIALLELGCTWSYQGDRMFPDYKRFTTQIKNIPVTK